jgi:hypothetical protein
MFCAIRLIIASVFFAFLALVAWFSPIEEFGDGREYILQTQAIVFDRTVSIDPKLRGPYWNETNPYRVNLSYEKHAEPSKRHGSPLESDQYGGGFGSLYPSKMGSYGYIHPWVYSAVVAPLYAALHAIAPPFLEYRAFLIANICFLFLPLVVLLRHSNTWRSLAFTVLVCCSPLCLYLQWSHTELFCFFCISMGFIGLLSTRWQRWSPLFLGLGAAQNIPIVLFLPLHLLLTLRSFHVDRWNLRTMVRVLLPYGVAGILPGVVALVSYAAFDTWNLLSTLGQADLSYLSIRKVASVFVSPMIGCLWYFPAAAAAALIALVCGRRRDVALFVFVVVCVAAVSSTTANISSAQLGAPRYSAWFLAPLYVLPFYAGVFRRRWSVFEWGTGATVVVLSLGVWWWLGTYQNLNGDCVYLLSAPNRLRPQVAALYRWLHLHDDIEPIVESVRGQELRFPHDLRGIYVWNLGQSSSLWIVSKRAYQRLQGIEVELASDKPVDTASLSQLFSIEQRDLRVFALRPLQGIPFDRHPYYGGYRLLWVGARVQGWRTQRELFVY